MKIAKNGMMLKPFKFLLILVSLLIGGAASADSDKTCLADYRTAQQLVPHELTLEQLQALQAFVDAGETAAGWQFLGTLGDKYSHVSFKVVSLDPKYKSEKFHKMVRNHWLATAGKEKMELFFQTVAAQHFKQYVEILHTGYWPDSDQILLSYLTAARDNGLSDIVVFDETWVRSGLNKLISWEKILGLHKARIVRPSIVCADIGRVSGFFRMVLNLFKLPFTGSDR